MSKILVVGDIHRRWKYLNILIETEHPDIILQCGDFGWWPLEDNRLLHNELWKLKGIVSNGCQIFWCDGNHEDHWSLINQPKSEIDYSGVTYMPRGTTVTLPDGRTVMFVGGAQTHNKQGLVFGVDWFWEETISYKDAERCLSYDGQVDIVVSHTCPKEFNPRYNQGNSQKCNDPSREYLSLIFQKFRPKQWFFGHFHLFQERIVEGTHFVGLDYPDHGDTWWIKL